MRSSFSLHLCPPPNGWGTSGAHCRLFGRVLSGALVAALLSGCSGDDETTDGCAVSACDIEDTTCQLQVFRATACEHGDKSAVMPPVRTITSAAFATELNDTITPDEDAASWDSALKQLRLLPATATLTGEVTAASVENIAAYYDSRTQGVTVIERNAPSDPVDDVFVLSHEFTHALQDQAADIFTLRENHSSSTDSFVALTSLMEGEATVIGLAVAGRSLGRTPEQLLWDRAIASMWDGTLQSIDEASAPLVTAVQGLPYPLGTAYLAPRWLAHGSSAFEEQYDAPLLSVLDWRSDVQVDEASLVEPLDCYPTTPPPEFVVIGSEQLGASGLLGLSVALGHSASVAWADSLDWRGDSLVVFRVPATNTVAAAWRIRWSSESAATEFGALLMGGMLAPAQIEVQGREVTLFVAPDALMLANWLPIPCGTLADLPTEADAGSSTLVSNSLRRGTRHPNVPLAPLHNIR